MNPEIYSQPPTDIHQGQTASVTVNGGQSAVRRRLEAAAAARASPCCCRGSHLTGVHAAGEELVQLDQLVRGDVELERDAVEGIVGAHL